MTQGPEQQQSFDCEQDTQKQFEHGITSQFEVCFYETKAGLGESERSFRRRAFVLVSSAALGAMYGGKMRLSFCPATLSKDCRYNIPGTYHQFAP